MFDHTGHAIGAQRISTCGHDRLLHAKAVAPSGCISNPLSAAAEKVAAPFLFLGGLTPTVTISDGATAPTVTATQSAFTMLTPIWGGALDAPSASTSIPF